MSDIDRVADVIQRSLLREVNGGELEPIWDIYRPEGVALVIGHALADAGLLATDTELEQRNYTIEFATGNVLTAADRAVLDAADEWYGWPCAATRTGHPAVDGLIAAVRARREAQQ